MIGKIIENGKMVYVKKTSKLSKIKEFFDKSDDFKIKKHTEIGNIIYTFEDDYVLIVDEKNNCNMLLSEDEKELLKVEVIDAKKSVNLVVPKGVEKIVDYACSRMVRGRGIVGGYKCKQVGIAFSKITLPKNSLVTIGDNAFVKGALDNHISINSVEVMNNCLNTKPSLENSEIMADSYNVK